MRKEVSVCVQCWSDELNCLSPTYRFIREECTVIQKDSCISTQLALSLFRTAGRSRLPLPSSD